MIPQEISLPAHRGESFLVSKRQILGTLASNAIQQSPYLPGNLERVLNAANDRLAPFFDATDLQLIEVTDRELIDIIEPVLKSIPEFNDWNLSKVEREHGISFDDENRPPFAFISRYGSPREESDFVDLDALIRNIANDCQREHLITQSI